jgi:hypothetical protein
MQHPHVRIAFNLKQHAGVHIQQAAIHFCLLWAPIFMTDYDFKKIISFLIQLMGGS